MQVAPQPGRSRLRVLVGRRSSRPGDGYSGSRHEVLVAVGRRPPRESSPSRWDSQIPGHDSGQEINMETTHHRQIEATQGQTQKILLAHWPSLQPKHAEQNYAL